MKQQVVFPATEDAPASLLKIDGGCGLLAAWGILAFYGRRTSTRDLIASCRYTKKYGVFTIALALALHEHGLNVAFHSDPDEDPKPIERHCYNRAVTSGLPMKGGIGIQSLLKTIGGSTVAIVFYNTNEDNGHFSPLLGRRTNRLILPYSDEGLMSVREFGRRWRAPEILRQCIIVDGMPGRVSCR